MCKNWFTGKRKDNGEWVEGFLFDDGLADSKRMFVGNLVIVDYTGIADNKFDIVGTYFYEVIPETVGQCTGLTDKNGKKIFEGNIIQTVQKIKGCKNKQTYKFVIKYGKYIPKDYCRTKYSQWQTIGFYAFDGKRDYQLSCFGDLLEVIGNIYDNPELLKGEEENA